MSREPAAFHYGTTVGMSPDEETVQRVLGLDPTGIVAPGTGARVSALSLVPAPARERIDQIRTMFTSATCVLVTAPGLSRPRGAR